MGGVKYFFRVENNSIVGGSLEKPIDKSYYLCTERDFENFELKLDAKFKTSKLGVNGGISFRARRVPNSSEVMGYQADIGYVKPNVISQFSYFTPKDTIAVYPLWGSLVDENRHDTSIYPRPDIFPVIFHKVADRELIEKLITPYDWNNLQIIVQDSNIEIKINGTSTVKFTEKNKIPTKGCICLQTHSGDPFEVWYRNIFIKEKSS